MDEIKRNFDNKAYRVLLLNLRYSKFSSRIYLRSSKSEGAIHNVPSDYLEAVERSADVLITRGINPVGYRRKFRRLRLAAKISQSITVNAAPRSVWCNMI